LPFKFDFRTPAVGRISSDTSGCIGEDASECCRKVLPDPVASGAIPVRPVLNVLFAPAALGPRGSVPEHGPFWSGGAGMSKKDENRLAMFSAIDPADVDAFNKVLPVVVPVEPGRIRTVRDPLTCSLCWAGLYGAGSVDRSFEIFGPFSLSEADRRAPRSSDTLLISCSSERRLVSGGFCGRGKNRNCELGIRTTSTIRRSGSASDSSSWVGRIESVLARS